MRQGSLGTSRFPFVIISMTQDPNPWASEVEIHVWLNEGMFMQ